MYWDVNYSNCAGGSSSSRVEEGKCCQLQMPQLTIWAWFAKLVCQTELPLFASACLQWLCICTYEQRMTSGLCRLVSFQHFLNMAWWSGEGLTLYGLYISFYAIVIPLFPSTSVPEFLAKSQAGLVYNPRCFVRGHWPFSLSTETQYYLPVWMCAVCTIPKCFLLCVYTWESADGHARYHLMRLLASQWVTLPWGGSYVQTVAERKKEVWGQRSIWPAMTRIFRYNEIASESSDTALSHLSHCQDDDAENSVKVLADGSSFDFGSQCHGCHRFSTTYLGRMKNYWMQWPRCWLESLESTHWVTSWYFMSL